MRNSEHSEAGQMRKIWPRMVRAVGWGGARTSRRGCRGVKGRERLRGRLAGTVPHAAQRPRTTRGREVPLCLATRRSPAIVARSASEERQGQEGGWAGRCMGRGEGRGESSMDGKCSPTVGL